MSSKPTLSICIPTYRRPQILGETLTHLSEIKELDLEVVVSDNASGDETREVVESLDAPHLVVEALYFDKKAQMPGVVAMGYKIQFVQHVRVDRLDRHCLHRQIQLRQISSSPPR